MYKYRELHVSPLPLPLFSSKMQYKLFVVAAIYLAVFIVCPSPAVARDEISMWSLS